MRLLVPLMLLALAPLARAEDALPKGFPNGGLFITDGSVEYEDYGFAEFRKGDPKTSGETFEVRGHHWTARAMPPKGNGKAPREALFEALHAKLREAGFTDDFVRVGSEEERLSMHKGTEPAATYVFLYLHDDRSRDRLEIVETAANPMHVSLAAPAGKPEAFNDKDDIPYLTPLPGSKLKKTEHDNRPMQVSIAHPKETESLVVADAYVSRWYAAPPRLSYIAFEDAYVDALAKAGWTVTFHRAEHGFSGAAIDAHYAHGGRDVWTHLRYGGDHEYRVDIADVGERLHAQAKECVVKVYGVNFDFDKATLRPDSEPVLKQVLSLFETDPKLAAEIGGHTDNVGKPDYNRKLSAERADAVRAWLVAHGVGAGRLTSRGYGDSSPVVPNDSDENRARNRRVELKRNDCSAKHA
ncbi:MAG: OmpA family protein [Bacillota bacterium]